jgi:glutaredoxin
MVLLIDRYVNVYCQQVRYDHIPLYHSLSAMTQICPKCSYIRKESDTSPPWQCPACEVAYTKAGDGASVHASFNHSKKTRQRTDSGIPTRTWKLLILFVVLAAFAWQSRTAFKKTHHRIEANSSQSSQQPEVILYGTTWCGYCAAARRFFDANGIRYTEFDTEKTTEGYEGHKKLGGGGVPLIVVGGDVMHGYNEAGLRQALAPWMQNN